ncbi:MAG: prepilin-type N-terminal cleavage/methylation domain-containing protein [Patescibacteria group bacterium]
MLLYSQQYKILKKHFCLNYGFTMIELIVSVGIIASLIAIFLANYHGANYRAELSMEVQKAVSNLNLARSFSLSSKKYDNGIPSGGWGIHFTLTSPHSYLIFADTNNDKIYNSGEADTAKGGRIITLPNNVVVDSTSNGGDVDIVFLSPDPIVYINELASSFAWIKFKETGNNTIKTITINSLGLSEISD